MNVKRKEKYVPLGDLEPGQRFRFKSEPSPQLLFQVCKVSPRCNWVGWNRDTDGYRSESPGTTLVEHVKGHWQPEDEEEGLVAIGDVDIFAVVDFDGEWWVHTNEGADSDCRCLRMLGKPSSCRYIRQERLVRVVHGTFVEGYKETES